MDETTEGTISARYCESDAERVLEFACDGRRASIAQNREGYAMLIVRDGAGEERERYYGLGMALDHAAELLGVAPEEVPVPDEAADMGM